MFNYGSFDPFVAVDLGLTSQKRGRSLAMLRKERSILDQVQVRSILRLILPEIVARNQIKLELQENISALSTSPPRQKVLWRQFPCFSHSNHHYDHIQRQQGPKHSPNCIVQSRLRRFEVFCTTVLDYSIPLVWTTGNPRVRRSRSMGTSISVDPLSSMENTPRSIFHRSIPTESVVHVHS